MAGGQKLVTLGRYKEAPLKIQGHLFLVELHVLEIGSYDVILGIQWLLTLGRMELDPKEKSLIFTHQNTLILLQGIQHLMMETSNKEKIRQEIRTTREILLMHIEEGEKYRTTPTDLTDQMDPLLQKYHTVFREPIELPSQRLIDHWIPLKDETWAVLIPPYRYLYFQKNEMEQWVKEFLTSGTFQSSTSPFLSLALLVHKQDDGWHFCVNYQALNNQPIKDKFQIPVNDELLDELGGANIFSKLDLRSRYHQIRVHEANVHKTAFHTHENHYEFLVMSFGLTNALSTFDIFRSRLRKFVLVFVDDILVYSQSLEDHVKHLEMVLQTLLENHLYTKKSMCSFGVTSMEYLSHIVSPDEVQPNPQKITDIQ